MGSSNSDYSAQINNALAQSNTPKSPLAKEFSGLLGGVAPNIMNALMNTQNLGNSFIGIGQNGVQQNANETGFIGNNAAGGVMRQAGRMTDTGYESDEGDTPTGTASPNEYNINPPMSDMEKLFFTQGQGFGLGGGPNGIGINPFMGLNLDAFRQDNIPQNGQGAFNALSAPPPTANQQALNLSALDPGAINMLRGGFIPPNLSQLNNPSQQIFNQIGGQAGQVFNNAMQAPSQVNAGQINAPAFNQQMLNPGNINANFQAQGANLNGVPNSTQLSPQNSEYYNSIANILQQQQDLDIANLRERFTGMNNSGGTGATFAEATMRAQSIPQLAAALGNVRQQEVANQLNQANLQQSGLLQNAQMLNQFGLGGAQLQSQNQGQNIANQMNAANLNNLTGLQANGMNLDAALANASNQLQAGMSNQGAGLNQNQNLTSLLSTLGNIGQQAGGQNLANTSLGVNAQQNNQQLQSQNANNLLGQLNQFMGNQNQAIIGQNQNNIANNFNQQNLLSQNANNLMSILSGNQNANSNLLGQLAQANQQQGNAFNMGIAGMNQQAAQQQIQNQLQSLMALFSGGLGMASNGMPGGGANVNIGNGGQQGGGFGSALSGLGSILAAFA